MIETPEELESQESEARLQLVVANVVVQQRPTKKRTTIDTIRTIDLATTKADMLVEEIDMILVRRAIVIHEAITVTEIIVSRIVEAIVITDATRQATRTRLGI